MAPHFFNNPIHSSGRVWGQWLNTSCDNPTERMLKSGGTAGHPTSPLEETTSTENINFGMFRFWAVCVEPHLVGNTTCPKLLKDKTLILT